MRSIGAGVFCVVLSCGWATAQDAAPSTQAGSQFVGQNVQVVADKFGLPTGRKKMDNDEMFYVWELGPPDPRAKRRRTTEGYGGRYEDGETPGYMTDDPRICKLTVIASPEGIVTQVTAEDENGTGAPKRTFGFLGSVCADWGLAR
ncbi:MAG TPA: hypothetical protein VFL62_02570 [Bradyrhizobium sp.]|uniref:hypothetical protein n=1 Tax=Bradyrhizobium sp. TaxID=376 RepID=UPI002D7E94F1|nr:hypothetical protein [Bradyrhizobium sp.]HET7885089.1 hypothetical protein [Bradyrhizobium sp.]